MNKKVVRILTAVCLILTMTSSTAFASNQVNENNIKSEDFISELEKAIEASPVLDSKDYDITKLSNSSRKGNGKIVCSNVSEVISYLEQQEIRQKKFSESVESISDVNATLSASTPLLRASGDITKSISYRREFITKYILSAKVKVNSNTGIISRVYQPNLKLSGGYGVSLEDKTYYTDIIDDTVAYVECEYTNVSEIKIPGVTDIEIRRANYRTYMHYRYDEVYDKGNEAI